MYIVIGAHVEVDFVVGALDAVTPVFYGTASDLALARKIVRERYLYVEYGLDDTPQGQAIAARMDDEYLDHAHVDATQVAAVADQAPHMMGDWDSIWIKFVGEVQS